MTGRDVAVGIVGTGAVAQAVGGVLVTARLCSRILVTGRTDEQAAALADDLTDMRTALRSTVHASTATAAGLRNCDAVVVTARASFYNARATDVRMGGVQANTPLMRALASQLAGYQGTVLVVTNPVDLMTRLFAEESGCTRVFGIGSSLDTARYRSTLARLLGVPLHAVRGHVIGEHGDAAVVCASSTTVNGHPVPVPLQEVRDELVVRPGRISSGIGRTKHGPAGAVASALRLALGVEDGSTELSAPFGDGFLGMPLRFTQGQPLPCMPLLDDSETRQLEAARIKLRDAYRAVRGIPTQPLPTGRNS
ncbi:lactate/malate family dehydrogenase [Streptomyces sp. JW3]|uniref:lactate/malate family dehydrogenase n=1 Tax=Streptomyces sp. JW3 TaxID=3456955 RepID=UPI003FA46689